MTHKILVVDDEELLREVLTRRLNRCGYESVAAGNAEQAMELLLEGDINLIITDVKMPGGSGFDLCGLAKMGGYELPVIVISGHEDFSDRVETPDFNDIKAFFPKPIDTEALMRKVDVLLARSQTKAVA